MIDSTMIICPKCGTGIKLTESLAGPLVAAARAELQREVDAERERAARAEREAAAKVAGVEREIDDRVKRREESLREAARREAAESIRMVHAEVGDLRVKLAEAQQAQAEAVRKERELEGRERTVTLTIEQGITAGVAQARDAARRDADEAARLRLAEKDTQLESMRRTIEDLQRKADQGSQQTQGEAQELELEAALRRRFPFDLVTEVAKGVNGADCEHVVRSPSGAECGKVLYESKRTKNWSAAWLPKLREDGRRAKADVLVLVTQALPEEVEVFGFVDGVWVVAARHVEPLAALVREGLLRVHAVRQAQVGMANKAELVYEYLTGPGFKHRVEAVVEAFTVMSEDLTAEKKAITRAWAKREQQIEKVLTSTTGLFGDLQGVAGTALGEIEGLGLKALAGGE